jgi:alpha-glucosidase
VCWALSNHDNIRVVSRWAALGGSEAARARVFAMLLLALPGPVCVYQGEELGWPEAEIRYEQLQDPYAKVLWPEFKGRDGCRTPMAWDSSADGGFGSGQPWLPLWPAHRDAAVAQQAAQADSPLAFWQQQLAWRRAQPALHGGDFVLGEADDSLLRFSRSGHGQVLQCVFNLGCDAANLPLAAGARVLLHSDGSQAAGQVIELAPMSAAFIQLAVEG